MKTTTEAKPKLTYPCLNCHGSGWYNQQRKWGCFRCGGLQYPSVQGTGIDPLSNALCILDNVLFDWIPVKEVTDKTVNYTKWSRKFTADYLNWMYKEGLIVIINEKAISVAVYNSLYIEDDDE